MLEHLRSWLVGQSRQPEQSLPEHGVLYFDHLYSEYRSLVIASRSDQADQPMPINPDVQGVIDELIKKRENLSLTWNDLYTLELMLTRIEPAEKLRRKVWSLRARYRDVAGPLEYDAYLASRPPELAEQPDAAGELNGVAVRIWRADIEYLLGELYLRYALSPVRERERNRGSKLATDWIGGLLSVLLVLTSVAAIDIEWNSWGITVTRPLMFVFILVVFLGGIGGLVSVQQRLQSASDAGDQLYNVSELMHAKSRWVSFVSGATFAAVLYLLITAGLLDGGLFPDFGDTNVDKFLLEAGPTSAANYAKLMIWAFLAGFAERLVPDTLSRFVARKGPEGKATT